MAIFNWRSCVSQFCPMYFCLVSLMILTGSTTNVIAADGMKSGVMQVPDAARAEQLQLLFAHWFTHNANEHDALQLAWQSWHWQQTWKAPLWKLQEKENVLGYGNYELNTQASWPAFIQAPHHPSDLYTAGIAHDLFVGTAARVYARSTVPRSAAASDGGNADLAHRSDSPLLRASLAFAQQFPDGVIVQIHAFDNDKRRLSSTQNADIILSNGTGTPDAALLTLADCLQKQKWRVLVYGRDSNELGATTNSIAGALRTQHFKRFVHAELSAPLRAQLRRDTTLVDVFARCLHTP